MSSPPFDTQKMTDRLESVGIPASQAKMQVSILADAIDAEDASIAERFSTKPDVLGELSAIRLGELTAINGEIAALKIAQEQTNVKIAELKSELMRWVVTVAVATGIFQTAIISALILKVVH